MIRYIKQIDKGNFFSILFVLFLSAGFLVLNDYISSAATIIMWTALLLYQIKKCKSFNSAYGVPALAIIAWYVISCLVNGDSIYTVLGCGFGFLVSLLFVTNTNFISFRTSYIEVMKVLCIISLVGFFSLSFISFTGQILSPFMSQTRGGYPFYNLYFFIYRPLHLRNMGMFWEPGAFQVFINIALLFEILKPKPSIVNIGIFLVTIITTFSTTSYIAVFLIFAMVFINRSESLKSTRSIFLWIFPILLVLYIYNSAFFNDTSSYSTFGKVSSFIEDEEWKEGGQETSGSIRFFSATKTLEAFIESPVFGQGTKKLEKRNYKYTYGMNTCTFVNWFGKYGIVYGLLMLIGFFRLSSLLGYNKGGLTKFLILMFLFIITSTEAMTESPLLNMLCLYGYNDKHILSFLKAHEGRL